MVQNSQGYSPDLHAATREDIFYCLVMYPYPSGYGLHVGHASNYTINDVMARFKRLQGKTVFNPFGFDSFGLPTENYAMKVGKPAYEVTKENIEYFLKQVAALNMSFDMERMVVTSNPDYYKRTQWIFQQLYKAGLVYRDELRVNRCPECQTVLANDQVVEGKCERCKSEIIQKKMPQWFIKITAYAERLLQDLDTIDRPEETKTAQRNWIGRSEGAEIDFEIKSKEQRVKSKEKIIIVDAVKTIIASDEAYTMESRSLNSELAEYLNTLPHKKVVATNAAGEKLDRIKELLKGYSFETFTLENNPSKIDVSYYQKLLQHLGVQADDILYFEHNEEAIESAKRAGIKNITQFENTEQIQTWINSSLPSAGRNKITLNFYSQQTFDAIKNGTKTIETRALNPEEPWRYFGDVKAGDVLKYVNRVTGDFVRVRVNEVFSRKGFDAVWAEGKEFLQKIYADPIKRTSITSVDELKAAWNFTPGYVEKVEEHGLVGFAFEIIEEGKQVTVFTTRPDTLYGVTALVLAPENTTLDAYIADEKKSIVEEYRKETMGKTAVQRQQDTKEKTGVFSGVYAIHPLTGETVPVRFADYVLPDYATGSVMLVPAHDERDREFAKKYALDIHHVIAKHYISGNKPVEGKEMQKRNNVLALVKHRSENKYACLDRSKPIFKSMIMGGVEEGETYEEAGKREIIEEAGFTDIKFVKRIPGEIHAEYYAAHKDVNRYSIEQCYYYELQSGAKTDKALDDEFHAMERVEEKDMDAFLRDVVGESAHRIFRNRFHTGTDCMTEPGILINSGQFDGLASSKAKQAIIEYLEKIGSGKRKITYRLRDRSVSRQRYRGSPIPVYYAPKENPLVPYYERTDSLRKVHEGEETFAKKTIQAILFDPKQQKYAVIHVRQADYYTFVLGGIEEGESPEETARREVIEETGYLNFRLVRHLGHLQERFRHPIKQRNQYGIKESYLFELIDATKQDQALEDHEDLEVLRMTKEEILQLPDVGTVRNYFLRLASGEEVKREGEYVEKYNSYNPTPASDLVPHLIPEEELPVILPLDVQNYKPKGKSPLEEHPTFPMYVAKDGNTYKRECDTLDTFMCSSFYFLRYPDARNDNELCDPTLLNKMFPIELYIGGKEHTVGHLLYSRFIHKFLYDQGYVSSPEPFQKLVHQGMVLGSDGRKMSKRRGNIIDPLEVIETYGADAVRMYLMFMGPVEQDKARNDNALKGMAKFLQRVAALQPQTGVNFRASDEYLKKTSAEHDAAQKKITSVYHKTVKSITEDMEKMKFNTAVSKIMILVNSIYDAGVAPHDVLKGLTTMIAPFATELAQTMRNGLGHVGDVHAAQRPIADLSKIADEEISLPVQINGKMRGNVEIAPGTIEENVLKEAQKIENIAKYLAEGPIKKVIYVQDKILNIII